MTADPGARRAFRHAQRVLERQLSGLVHPARLDAILHDAVSEVAERPGADPARRLRDRVGARLLDAVGDLLARVDDELPAAGAPADAPAAPPVRTEGRGAVRAPSAETGDSSPPAWTPSRALRRRVG